MIRALLLALTVFAPTSALALSCIAPSVERSFAQYDASEEIYLVVHGRLTLDESALPQGMMADRDPPDMTLVSGRLRGASLAEDGFVLPFDQEVTLEVACLGPWCGGARNGESVLAFVRKDAESYALEIGPCGGAVFGTPRPQMLKAARHCLKTRSCVAE